MESVRIIYAKITVIFRSLGRSYHFCVAHPPPPEVLQILVSNGSERYILGLTAHPTTTDGSYKGAILNSATHPYFSPTLLYVNTTAPGLLVMETLRPLSISSPPVITCEPGASIFLIS